MIQKTVMQSEVPTGIRRTREELLQIPVIKKIQKLKLRITEEPLYQFPET